MPIFHSRDLKQIGNILGHPSQLLLTGVRMSHGIFAPTLRCHDGTYYLITTNISDGGNLCNGTNPAGPWSELCWLPDPWQPVRWCCALPAMG